MSGRVSVAILLTNNLTRDVGRNHVVVICIIYRIEVFFFRYGYGGKQLRK